MIKIALVDNESLYSANLINGFQKIPLVSLMLYAPKSFVENKPKELVSYSTSNVIKIWTSHLYFLQVLKAALKTRPDIIHIQFEFLGIHTFGPVYCNLFLPLLLFLLKLNQFKVVVTLHAVLPLYKLSKIRMMGIFPQTKIPIVILKWILKIFVLLIGSLANGIIVHKDFLKECLTREYYLNRDKIYVIPHGVISNKPNLQHDRLDYWRSKLGNHDVILYFGVLSPRKGIELLLKSYSMIANNHPNSVLVIVGGESFFFKGYANHLKSLVKELGIDQKVKFLGSLPDEDAHTIFHLAKIVVFPYIDLFSASGSLCWAIQHEKPIVATDIESFREFKDFILLVTKNVQALASGISRLIYDNKLRDELIRRLELLKSSRSWEEVSKKHLEIYYEILKGKRIKRIKDFCLS